MTNPYQPRWRARCDQCGWFSDFCENHVARTATVTHGILKPDHFAYLVPIKK